MGMSLWPHDFSLAVGRREIAGEEDHSGPYKARGPWQGLSCPGLRAMLAIHSREVETTVSFYI